MIATFAMSDSGKVFGRTCQRFGKDPADYLEDDVLGVNFRVALAIADTDFEPEESDPFADSKAKAQAAFG